MNPTRKYFVYITASKRNGTIYTGITNNLRRRMSEHQVKRIPGFTQKYGVTRLVYFEEYADVRDAIAREKQIKGWLRRKKLALIESANPGWESILV